MNELEISAVVIGLTQVIKGFGIPKNIVPVISVLLATLLSAGDAYTNGTELISAGVKGIVIGLTASGLYSAGKSISKAK